MFPYMLDRSHSHLGSFRQRRLLVCVAVAALALAVAHRTFHVSSTVTTTLQAINGGDKNQHLANDAHSWAIPLASFVLFLFTVTRGAPLARPARLVRAHLQQCLYKRPPPGALVFHAA